MRSRSGGDNGRFSSFVAVHLCNVAYACAHQMRIMNNGKAAQVRHGAHFHVEQIRTGLRCAIDQIESERYGRGGGVVCRTVCDASAAVRAVAVY